MSSKGSGRPKKSKAKRSGRNKHVTKTKVVVRRLPPNLPEELFKESVKKWANEETTDWFRFHKGRISKSKNKEAIFSRAYFHFKLMEDVLEFHRNYDNHLFVDNRGNETRCVVEFAPYQKLPKERKKPDPRQGSIETDPDYLAFLELLKAEEIKEPSNDSGFTQLEKLESRLSNITTTAPEKPKSTPLLDYLRLQKSKPSSPKSGRQAPIAILAPPAGSKNSAKNKAQGRPNKSSVKISIQQRQKDRIRSIIQKPASASKSSDPVETNSNKDTSNFSINTTNVASGSTSTSNVPASPSNKQKSNSTPTTPTAPMSPTRDYHGSHHNRRRDRDRDKRHSLEARPVIKILSKSSNTNKEGTNSSTAATNVPTGSSNSTASNTGDAAKTTSNTPSQPETSVQPAHHSSGNGQRRGYYARRGRW
ncbi:3183_t:CDS:2 [Paraglomus occultum]|uniref:3183_t:CDS:1 n=1 Tax=Paraglomus occultum TaxID=144539 RepID=A0A9N8WHG2_9GLOM|nr:3183_t:CDS:2 [Paraglomus occultum]